ncbi:hypothetical protein [Sunxiuqinia elliptica]|uniref:Uncharacterized protein n=1 Tax=Sunxiuqinia elliptica TaxID=655355 RepID=A0A1I2GS52_9BACT|nr:hypothetical protein [Sunxiuqinia elliptica]SFF19381.1 hypothetical protein SAMN05216283_10366 [Sunxiuqinia elliptica]
MNIKVKQILKEAHKALYTEDTGDVSTIKKIVKIFVFDLFPGLVAIFLIFTDNILDSSSSLIGSILTTCSIFAGLLFSLIIVIVDKAKKIKETKNEEVLSEFYYLKKYLRFSKHLITKISYTILISLLVIVFSAFLNLNFGLGKYISFVSTYKLHIISFFIYYFSIQFILLIIDIVSDMYDVFLEEID